MSKRIVLYPVLIMLVSFFLPFAASFMIALPESIDGLKIPVSSEPADVMSKTEKTAKKDTIITVFNTKSNEVEEKVLEEYLCGVVAAEMPASYEYEALKAQAVAARTYIISKINTKNPDHSGAALCTASTHCKGYISVEEANKKWGDNWTEDFYPKIRQAVTDTEGEYMTYNGEPIEAFFFAMSNGKTENSGDVWGNDLPYLVSTGSSFDTAAPNFMSTVNVTVKDFNERLKSLESSFKPLASPEISDKELTEGGRIKAIKINGTKFSGTDIRSAFGLKSADFSIKKEGDEINFSVRGNGHGVGMSQYGANCLAKNGKDYKEILAHYYKGIEIITK